MLFMKKKLFITNTSLEMGGIEKSLVNLLKNIDYEQYEVDLFLISKKGRLLSEVPKKVRIFSYEDIFKQPYNLIKFLMVVFKNNFVTRRLVQKKLTDNYDVAIAFDGYNNIADIVAALVKAKKSYIWVHSDYKERIKASKQFKGQFKRMQKKYNYFDNVVAVSKGVKMGFHQLMPEKNVIVCYNIIDNLEIEKKLQMKADYVLKGDIKIVGLGRVIKAKGFDRFVDIIARLQNEYPEKAIRGYIIGDGPEKNNILQQIKNLKLENSVILLGEKQNPFPILKQGDLFLMTSYIEGFALVLLESLVSSVPIVIPNVASARELCQEIAPQNSYVLTAPDVNSLYDGVKRAIDNLDNMQFSFAITDYNAIAKKQLNEIIN